jgi:hypothetical protein
VVNKPVRTLLGLLVLAGCGGGQAATNPAASAAAVEEDAPAAATAAQKTDSVKTVAIDSSLIPEPGQEIPRESFNYRGGTRDPFKSLLEGRSVGPELGDLDLVSVAHFARDPKSSSAVLWDRVNLKQYTAHEGERIGRARVVSISQRSVEFTIDDFGTQRNVTLVIRKREDVP